MGIRASQTAEMHFHQVKVPKENLLGNVGWGFWVAMQTLDGGRISVAAQALGIAQSAFDHMVSYMNEREQFGVRLGIGDKHMPYPYQRSAGLIILCFVVT